MSPPVTPQLVPTGTRRAGHNSPDPAPAWITRASVVLNGLVAVGVLAAIGILLAGKIAWQAWADSGLILVAAATLFFCLRSRLPWQNVAACGAVLLGVWAMAFGVDARTDSPFGGLPYVPHFGPVVLGIPWQMPLLCVVALLSARGTARLILRPWRRQKYYGYWLLGVAAVLGWGLLMVACAHGDKKGNWWDWLRPDASAGKAVHSASHTLWTTWYGIPWSGVVVLLILAVVSLAMATPWLIRKRSLSMSIPDPKPALLYGFLLGYLTVATAVAGAWPAAGIGALCLAGAAVLATRGWIWTRASLNPPPPASSPSAA